MATAAGLVSYPSGADGGTGAPGAAGAAAAGTAAALRTAGLLHTLTLHYDEALDEAASPPAAAYTVRVSGAARAVASATVQGASVRLRLAAPVAAGQVVTVSYAAPSGATGTPLRDLAGNVANDLAPVTVSGGAAAAERAAGFARVNRAVLPYAAATLQAGAVAAISRRVDAAGSAAALPGSGHLTAADRVAASGGAPAADVRQVLSAARFLVPLASGAEGTEGAAPVAALWGSGDYRSLSGGDQSATDWRGSVTSFQVGGDLRVIPELLAGIAVAWSEGAFEYTDRGAGAPAADGVYETAMVSVYPYVGLSAPEAGLRFWLSAGYGWGEVRVDEQSRAAATAPGWLLSGAAGGSGRLLAADGLIPGGRTMISLKGEGSLVHVEVEESGLLAATALDTRRLRVLLEGSHAQSLAWGARVQPQIEVGLRHEDGDGPQGTGLELGGALSYADPGIGLTVQGNGRVLVSHDSAYEEWGAGGLARLELGAGGRGLWLSVAPSWGDPAGGARVLWEHGVAAPGAAGRLADAGSIGRVQAQAGYGFAAGAQGGLLTPYGALTLDTAGDRQYRGGVHLEQRGLALSLEATRHEAVGQAPEHGVTIGVGLNY